jgi:thymidylate kinase
VGTTLGNYRKSKAIAGKLSPVIELVGPAGAGKTTLAMALARRNKRIRIVDAPFCRKIADLPFFIRNVLLLLPTFFSLRFNHQGMSPTRRHLAWMAILNGWHIRLYNKNRDAAIRVMDQGPIFLISQLLYFGPECLRSRRTEKWWGKIFRNWAVGLDEVYFLNASDSRLMERIRARYKWHLMKEEPDSKVVKFLAQYRKAYELIISMLRSNKDNLKVVYFDTGRISIDEMVNRILDEYNLQD